MINLKNDGKSVKNRTVRQATDAELVKMAEFPHVSWAVAPPVANEESIG